MPPELDPAQPPMNPANINSTGSASGHKREIRDHEAVVVITVTTSNDA